MTGPEALFVLLGVTAVVTALIVWGNLDGGPWSDYVPGLRRWWKGEAC